MRQFKQHGFVMLPIFLVLMVSILSIPVDSKSAGGQERGIYKINLKRTVPASPARLHFEDKVLVQCSYTTRVIGGVRIEVRPFYRRFRVANAIHGCAQFYPLSSGTADLWFSVLIGSGQVPVDSIRLRIYSPDLSDVLLEKFFPVNFIFTAGPEHAGPFKVTRLIANILSDSYQGPCPHSFEFRSWITANGKGIVHYCWVHSDGWKSTMKRVAFGGPSTKHLTHTWTMTSTGSQQSHWVALEILAPNPQMGNKAHFVCICE